MSREANIPLVLWISAALVFHFMGGGGGAEVAQTVLDKKDLQNLIARERNDLRPPDTVFEILGVETLPVPGETAAAPPDKDSEDADNDVEPDPDSPPDPVKLAEKKKKDEEAKVDKPPEVPKPEAEKKVVVPLPVVPIPAQPAPAMPPPPPPDKRISVRQNAEKNQPDNPNAPRLADDANHVAEETMAKIRSHDQDSAKPNPGAQKALGPKDETGNSDQDKEADSEERQGRDDKAPGEAAPVSTSAEHSNPGHQAPAASPVHVMPSVPGMNGTGARSRVAEPSSPPPSPGGAGPSSPDAQLGGGKSDWSMDPANPGGNGSSRTAGRRRPGGKLSSPIHVGSLGLGGTGVPGGPNINLTMPGLEIAIGSEKLRQEREADGASRRGEHAGRIAKGTDFQKYRAAIENYEPSVKLGDRTALNAARSPFATYLTTIHNKIHPFFAERELDAMDKTPDHGLTDQQMYAVAEIVLAADTGRIVRRGIVKNSGSTVYDMIVLKSIDSAGPFGKAPEATISPDGRVYLHWEFHRNRFDACSTRNAFPIMKRATGETKLTPSPTGAPPKPKTSPTDEKPGAQTAPLRPLRE